MLETRCPECGFLASELDPADTGTRIREMLPSWRAVLRRSDVATRRDPSRWSDLEYGCHVRDVFSRFDTRVGRMLVEDGPRFENWDQDATAIDDRYAEQDPAAVAEALVAAGATLAARFDSVSGDAWSRTGVRSDGAAFTVATLAQYFLHDPLHHLWDVGAEKP